MRFLRKMKFGKLAGLAVGTMALGSAVANGKPAVGYMLDISRDKVPTMATLKWLVDLLARLGYNEFQLYTEHAWAARGSGTTDRLTSDRVRGDSVMLDPSARRLRVRLPVEKS